ncbi:MAG: hypothetical protein ACI4QY_00235 [Oscillospiraceae bacterium]
MTVWKMRKLMLKKVVPEKVIPQNIVDFLMDENAELAEVDAYTFLTRLRGLGVGSADFIYLLEGCGAPEAAVLKIKSNPAMNLQSLILTMENAGMTSRDYMRILFTARQIWEHVTTTQLEIPEEAATQYSDKEPPKVEKTAIEDAEVKEEPPADEKSPADEKALAEKTETFAEEKETAPAEADEIKPDAAPETESVPTDTSGFSLGATEEFATLLGGNAPSDYAQPVPRLEDEDFDFSAEIADGDEVLDEYLDEQNTITPASPEDLQKEKPYFDVEIDYKKEFSANNGEDELTENEDSADENSENEDAPENAESAEPAEEYHTQPYNGDTTAIIKIDRKLLEENLANIAKNAGTPEYEEQGEDSVSEEYERLPVDDDYDEDYDYVRGRPRYYRGALITASVGAAVVVASGVAVGAVFGMEPPAPIGYAVDENEIFTSIYYSYEEKFAGGDSYYPYALQNMTVFGDMLVKQDGFGTFTQNDNVYTLASELITVNKLSGGELLFVGTLDAPENTSFEDAVQADDGSLVVAFSGDSSGFMKISGGEVLYTVRQDGKLTDFSVSGLDVRLGTVYTPKFYVNFTAADTEVYLPKLGKDYAAMSPQSVIPSGTKGYSYGVSAAYSLENGDTLRADAAMGNPVFASGDGAFMLNSADAGVLIRVDYSAAAPETADSPAKPPRVCSANCGKFGAAAFGDKGSAAFENGTIVLRDNEFKTKAILQNFTSIPETMRFCGDVLLAADKDKIFLAVDCTDLSAPAPVGISAFSGKADGNTAVILEQTAEGLRVASYSLDEAGAAVLKNESVLKLTGEQRGTLKLGKAAAIVADESACGAAYSYFDGVSVISEFVLLGDTPKRVMLYDDKKGIDMAFSADGKVFANCGKGLVGVEQ